VTAQTIEHYCQLRITPQAQVRRATARSKDEMDSGSADNFQTEGLTRAFQPSAFVDLIEIPK